MQKIQSWKFLQGGMISLLVLISIGCANAYKADLVKNKSSGTQVELRSVAFGNSKWVATGEHGTIITSSDGIDWK